MFFAIGIVEPSSLLPMEPLQSSSPTQAEIVSITGALIVTSFLTACVLLTHLFNAIHELRQRIAFSDIVHRTLHLNMSLGNVVVISACFAYKELHALLAGVKHMFYTFVLRNHKKKFL